MSAELWLWIGMTVGIFGIPAVCAGLVVRFWRKDDPLPPPIKDARRDTYNHWRTK